jgi:hypothetical protein
LRASTPALALECGWLITIHAGAPRSTAAAARG